MKYTRLYGVKHKRTEGQFQVTWNELQGALPRTGDGGFLLGVSDNKLLLEGIPLETGQAERSFAQLLTAAGLASIHFSSKVTLDDFTRLVSAFAMGGSKAQDFAKQIKETLGDNKNSSIRINEVKFVAADPATGEISVAAQIAAQSLGPEFKQWLNDPQKLLQLIAAAQGATSGGGDEAPVFLVVFAVPAAVALRVGRLWEAYQPFRFTVEVGEAEETALAEVSDRAEAEELGPALEGELVAALEFGAVALFHFRKKKSFRLSGC